MYFTLNKKLDNFVNYLLVDLNMDNLSEHLHKMYAHGAAGHADSFSDYNALYSYKSTYNTINGETTQFANIIDGIENILDCLIDIDNGLTDAIKVGEEEDNKDYVKFINDEFIYLRKFKAQFILLNDKIGKAIRVGNTIMDVENNYEKYLIPLE